MKIVYCTQGVYKSGGIERVIAGKANYLINKGFEVIIITTDQMEKEPFFTFDKRIQFIDLGIDYESDNQYSRLKRIFISTKKKKTHKALLSQVLNELKADTVVSVFFQEADFLPQIKDGSRKILELHTSKYAKILMYPKSKSLFRLFGKFRVWKQENIASKYDCFVILTQEEKKKWHKLSNVQVMPNSLPFNPTVSSLSNNKNVITVGRFEYSKNFSELLDIWHLIKTNKSNLDWTLNIVGDGYLHGALESKIKELNIGTSVNLLPVTNDIQKLYSQSSIVVLTSHFEGLPMVLLEAQAMGLPIVSYSCPSGPKDIVSDGIDGFLIEPGDKKTFANKLQLLMDNEEQRIAMGKAAKKYSERFTSDKIMAKWIELFEKIANEKQD